MLLAAGHLKSKYSGNATLWGKRNKTKNKSVNKNKLFMIEIYTKTG